MIKVGSCSNPWGIYRAWTDSQIPWRQFLDEFQQSGFHYYEAHPYGYTPTDAAVLNEEFGKRGIRPVSFSLIDAFDDDSRMRYITEQAHRICRCLNDIGGEYLILMGPRYRDTETLEINHNPEMSEDEWKRFIKNVAFLSHLAKDEYGINLVFHPHADMCIEYTHQIERFLNETDPGYVNLCFDTGHHAMREQDIYAFMDEHLDRCTYLHLKNINMDVAKEFNRNREPLKVATNKGVFTMLDSGYIDFAELHKYLVSHNWNGYAMLERDSYPKTEEDYRNLLPLTIKDREYLERIGFGEI